MKNRKTEKPKISAAEAANLIALHIGANPEDEELQEAIDWRFQMLIIRDKEETPAQSQRRAKLWQEICRGTATAAQQKEHEQLLAKIAQKAKRQVLAERAAQEK